VSLSSLLYHYYYYFFYRATGDARFHPHTRWRRWDSTARRNRVVYLYKYNMYIRTNVISYRILYGNHYVIPGYPRPGTNDRPRKNEETAVTAFRIIRVWVGIPTCSYEPLWLLAITVAAINWILHSYFVMRCLGHEEFYVFDSI